MSDISSFAEWEAQHQHSVEGHILTERQQQLIDMADEHRIWGDRDSSNDYRSSASDNESEDIGIKLPAHREERRTVNGEGHDLIRGIGLNMGHMRDSEIPSSTMEPSQQLSQRLDEVHPPSSQPRRPSSSIASVSKASVRTSTNSQVIDPESSPDDPLAGYDVLESEKEFLLSILDTAPKEEVEALMAPTDSQSPQVPQFYFTPTKRSTVEMFIQTHPHWTSRNMVAFEEGGSVDDQVAEFKKDVYHFAIATGMGKHEAKFEVMRAVAAWRKEHGLGGEELEESEEESDDYLASPIPRVNPMQWDSAEANVVADMSKKRKREASVQAHAQNFSSQAVEVDEGDAKRLKKERKRERKKVAREKKKQETLEQKAAKEVKEQNGDRKSTKESPLESSSNVQKPAHKTPAKERKKTKLGPTASGYFAKAPVPSPKSKPEPSVTDDASSDTPHDRQRATKRRKGETLVEDRPISAAPVIDTQTVVKSVAGSELVVNTVQEDELAQPDYDHPHALEEHDLGRVDKKRKRKKKRNQNRLLTGPQGQEAQIGSTQEEAIKIHAEKRSRTEAFVEDLPEAIGEEETGIAPGSQDTGQDVEPTAKRNRRKHKTSLVEPAAFGDSRLSQSVPDNTEMLLDDLDTESVQKVVNSNMLATHESSVPPPKKKRRDRQRKSKSTHREDAKSTADPETPHEGDAIMEPLAELANTNLNSPTEHRKERDRGRKRERDDYSEDSTSGSLHLDAQVANALAEEANPQEDVDGIQGDGSADVYDERPGTPDRRVSVVIYTPSNASTPEWRRPATPAAAIENDDDKASVFSMADYGALDWDHSGDESEFERTSVSPKPKRRASSAHPLRKPHFDTKLALPIRKKPRAMSCPVAIDRRALQPRDAKGRFARSGVEVGKTQRSAKKRQRPSSSSSSAAHQQRDASGRFARIDAVASRKAIAPKKEKSVPLARPSSRSGEVTDQPRDNKGRFASTPAKSRLTPVANPVVTSIPVVEIPTQRPGSEAEVSTIRPAKRKTPSKAATAPSSVPAAAAPLETPAPKADPSPSKTAKAKKPPAKSPYFPAPISPPKTPKSASKSKTTSPSKRPPGGLVSCIPFPPLSAPYFGLIQEKLAHDPFRLLIAVTFLIRTHGKHAIPVFYSLMSSYPTPQTLIDADKDDIVGIIRHLGLQNSRAATYQTYAKIWIEDPPVKGKRYAVKGYPEQESGRDIPRDIIIDDEDPRVAWEIGHMTSGPYALDSWRIFCRDILRGVAAGWNGEGTKEGFQPEWMRVLPEDKELRAYLRWMWLKEGFEWDPFTGDKEVASAELARAAMEGRIAWDDRGGMTILDEVAKDAVLVQGGAGSSQSSVVGKQDAMGEIPDSDLDDDDVEEDTRT